MRSNPLGIQDLANRDRTKIIFNVDICPAIYQLNCSTETSSHASIHQRRISVADIVINISSVFNQRVDSAPYAAQESAYCVRGERKRG